MTTPISNRRHRSKKCKLSWILWGTTLLVVSLQVLWTSHIFTSIPETSFHTLEKQYVRGSAPKFAYAFLMAGCDPSAPLTYRNYIFNILVAAKLLRTTRSLDSQSTPEHDEDRTSTSDVIVMVQFSKASNATILPAADREWFDAFHIRVRYLPTPIRDNFYNAQLEKFRILELTDYQRVMYLDADVLPLCSLDYLMELSVEGVLQPNIVLAWFTEPAHGGLFVLETKPGYYHPELTDIIQKREAEALRLAYPHWDPIRGWGHVLKEPWTGLPQPWSHDHTTGARSYLPPRTSTNWTFHGDFADQGLLFYWTRFHRQQVSIIKLGIIENWNRATARNGEDSVVKILNASQILGARSCLPQGMEFQGRFGSTLQDPLFLAKTPHRDFIHFSGDKKPWEQAYTDVPKSLDQVHSSTDYWYFRLQQIFDEYAKRHPGRKMPKFPLKFKKPSLGRYPTHRSMIGTIQKKKRKAEQQRNEEVQTNR